MTAEVERRGRQRTRPHPPAPRQPGELPPPEWVMVGVPVDAGVRLYASREIPHAQFAVEVQERHGTADGWHLDAQLRQMLVITRPSYPECLEQLTRIWANQDAAGHPGQETAWNVNDQHRKAIGR